jgi:hypothetical protein
LIWSFTKTTTPPPILPTLSRRNGGNLYPGILSVSSLTWGRNQLSVNESISWQEYSAAIRSNFGVILWIFKWRKETELCIKLLTVVATRQSRQNGRRSGGFCKRPHQL